MTGKRQPANHGMAKERDSFRGPDGRAGTASLAPAGGPTERAGLSLLRHGQL